MRKLILIFIAASLFFIACKKENTSAGGDEITYEATVTKGGFSSISYADETENWKDVEDIKTNSWKVTFKNKAPKPRELFLMIYPNLDNQQYAVKIYVNGKLVYSDSGTDWYGLASYTLQP